MSRGYSQIRLAAVRCLTPVCAQLTLRDSRDPAPPVCPVCAGPVEPFELQRPGGSDERRNQ